MRYLTNGELKEIMLDNGVLHEVNRTFFHPLGMALTIQYYEENDKANLLLQQDNDKEGTVFKHLDRFKMQMFRDFCSDKHMDREDKFGFIIQTRDFEESDENYRNNKKLKTKRLEIIFKHFRTFCFNMQKKFIKHHEDVDDNNQFVSKDVIVQRMKKAYEDNDWVSVAAWAMLMDSYISMKHEIISLKEDEDNG